MKSKESLILMMVAFKLLVDKIGKDVKVIGGAMVTNGLDELCDGFWVLDIKNDIEYYSPKFRSSLGFEGEEDFPSVPASWKKQINPGGLAISDMILERHIRTKSEYPYYIDCLYTTKQGTQVELICQGDVLYYDRGGDPELMFGIHSIK